MSTKILMLLLATVSAAGWAAAVIALASMGYETAALKIGLAPFYVLAIVGGIIALCGGGFEYQDDNGSGVSFKAHKNYKSGDSGS